MRHRVNIVIMVAATLIAVWGCAKTDNLDNSNDSQNGETIECAVSFSVAPMNMGTKDSSDDLATRAADSDTDVDETTIKNLWVVQFNVDDDVIGVKYIADVTDLTEVSLVPTSRLSTVYYIANTFDTNLPIFEGMSVDEVEALGGNLYSIDDVVNVGSDDNKYLLMSGSCEYTNGTKDSEKQTVELSRNVAKINFSVEVSDGIGLTITDIKVCAIPQNLNYIFGDEDIYPVTNDFTTFTYDVDYSAVENNQITFYMPENRRGETTSTSEADKAIYAPINATYIEVYAEYTDGDNANANGSRIYTFYLGENFTNDFNITHNTKYDYKINFTSLGDPETDSRIEDFAPIVDFTDLSSSNCYILNTGSSTSRIFYIPIADRINTFWGNVGYEDVAENKISETSELVCEIIWGDNYTPNSDNTGFEKITIERETYNGKNAIKATIDCDIPYGNIVVGVRRSTSTNYLWSWHLWITDYNPDTGMEAQDGVYRYQVPGGEIHRYKDLSSSYPMWENGGDLAGKFIMDRNIGHIDGDSDWDAISLLYQCGRKDPFPGYLEAKKPNGTAFIAYTDREYYIDDIKESIYRPNAYFISLGSVTAWCTDTKYNNSSIRWCDPTLTTSSTAKSLFDPSPLGWKVMKSATIRDLTDSDNVISNNSNSCSYYIDGELVETYYRTGNISNSSAIYSPDYRGLFWGSDYRGVDIRIYPSAPAGSPMCGIAGSAYSYGFQLRCVQE